MKKEKALNEIVKIMQNNNLTLDEVADFLCKQKGVLSEFDLLCLVNNNYARLPFAEGIGKNPQGLYPIKNDNRYLELTETEMTLRKFANERFVLPEEFCEQIYPLRAEINTALKLLSKPLLQGCYFAKGKEMPEQNWIVGFDDNSTGRLASDYYDADEMAKIRYFGVSNF